MYIQKSFSAFYGSRVQGRTKNYTSYIVVKGFLLGVGFLGLVRLLYSFQFKGGEIKYRYFLEGYRVLPCYTTRGAKPRQARSHLTSCSLYILVEGSSSSSFFPIFKFLYLELPILCYGPGVASGAGCLVSGDLCLAYLFYSQLPSALDLLSSLALDSSR